MTDLLQLRSGLHRNVGLFLGGAAALGESARLKAQGAEVVDSLAQFRTALQHRQEQG